MANVGRICYPTRRRLAKPPYICPDLLRRYANPVLARKRVSVERGGSTRDGPPSLQDRRLRPAARPPALRLDPARGRWRFLHPLAIDQGCLHPPVCAHLSRSRLCLTATEGGTGGVATFEFPPLRVRGRLHWGMGSWRGGAFRAWRRFGIGDGLGFAPGLWPASTQPTGCCDLLAGGGIVV